MGFLPGATWKNPGELRWWAQGIGESQQPKWGFRVEHKIIRGSDMALWVLYTYILLISTTSYIQRCDILFDCKIGLWDFQVLRHSDCDFSVRVWDWFSDKDSPPKESSTFSGVGPWDLQEPNDFWLSLWISWHFLPWISWILTSLDTMPPTTLVLKETSHISMSHERFGSPSHWDQ